MTGIGNGVDVDGIGKSYGAVTALQDVTFDVGWGEVVALLGPNGAGKSTAVEILATLTRPDRGHARVAGHDVVTEAALVRRSITLTGQNVSVDELLTGYENLVMFGRLRGLAKSAAQDRARELLAEFGLNDAADRRVGTYSGGMRRRVDIACGLVVRPRVAFLDEPTTGLDPRSRQAIWGLIDTFKESGIATLLTTQYLEEADALSDRIVVLDGGRIVAQGTGDDLKERIGGTFCEFVPKNPADVAAIAQALGPLLSETSRAAITPDSDRVIMPAPDGLDSLAAAFTRLQAADIELADMALRRPSLDDVFLALTGKTAGDNGGEPDAAFEAGS
jgi:ABC-2 type transport system ATP-binding protein